MLIEFLTERVAELYDIYGDCGKHCNHPSGLCNDSYHGKPNCKDCEVSLGEDFEILMRHGETRKQDCIGCCLECTEEIHWHRSFRKSKHRTEYNCQKLAYYYTCRYSWKYCSEVMYAIENINFANYDDFRILSLGSGPTPDLMAFEQVNGKMKKSIHYTGVDVNSYWKTIFKKIEEYCDASDIDASFKNEDIFDFLKAGLRSHKSYKCSYSPICYFKFPRK